MNAVRLSIRGYAKHRGVDEKAVRKALLAGRITKGADGKIDPDVADRQWSANTDPSRTFPARLTSPRSTPRQHADAPSPHPSDEATAEQFARARATNEGLKARERQLRIDTLEGQLVDHGAAKRLFFGMARQVRDAWLGWPARIAADFAATLNVDPHKVQTELDRLVRAHLNEQADAKFDLARFR